MSLRIDPAQAELRALKKVANWTGKRVLEIGCGDGRLTLRLASLGPRKIEALDPSVQLVRMARKTLPFKYRKRVEYHVGKAEKLKYPEGLFDIVVFSWVL